MAVPDLQDALDHLQKKEVDEAIATLERKTEELPAHLTAHVLLARAYESKQQWQKALQRWKDVCFLMPNSPVAQSGKARVLDRISEGDGTADSDDASGPLAAAGPEDDADAAPSDDQPDETPPADSTGPAASEPQSQTSSAESDTPSELEQLRRQAEREARQGGARAAPSGPTDASSSPQTPKERVGQFEDEGDDDLDRLIDELESAQIEPDPDVDDAPPPDLDNDEGEIVSETLARIHAAQDEHRKAAQIYVKLASQEPDRAREHLEQAAQMRKKAEEQAS